MRPPSTFPSEPLVTLLRACDGDSPALEHLRATGWQSCREQVARLAPALWQAHEPRLTPEENAQFKANRRRCTLRYWALRGALAGVLRQLESRGIEALVMKGVALTETYSHGQPYRWMDDFDILVRPEDRLSAHRCLLENGFEARVPLSLYADVEHGNHYTAAQGMNCDLHWFSGPECLWTGADGNFWRRRCPLQIEGVQACTLSAADMLLHVCLRGFTSSATGHWVLDALQVLRGGGVDWTILRSEAEQRKVSTLLHASLSYLAHSFAAPIPAEVLSELSRCPASVGERVYCWLKGRHRNWLSFACLPWLEMQRQQPNLGFFSALFEFPRFLARRWSLTSTGQLPAEIAFRIRAAWALRGHQGRYFPEHLERVRAQRAE